MSPFYSVLYNSNGLNPIVGSISVLPKQTSDQSIYMAGSLNNKISLFKFSQSDGSNQWIYSVKDTAGVSTIAKMTQYDMMMSSSINVNHIGCADNLGSNLNAIGFVFY